MPPGTPVTEPGPEATFLSDAEPSFPLAAECSAGTHSKCRLPAATTLLPPDAGLRRAFGPPAYLPCFRIRGLSTPVPLTLPVALAFAFARTAGKTGRRGAPLDQTPELPCRVLQVFPPATP